MQEFATGKLHGAATLELNRDTIQPADEVTYAMARCYDMLDAIFIPFKV